MIKSIKKMFIAKSAESDLFAPIKRSKFQGQDDTAVN